MLRNPASQPYILVFLATLFWAGNAIAGKIAVGHISPFLLTTLRWGLAVLVMLPFAISYIRRDWTKIRANIIFLFTLSILGFTIFNNLMYLALTSTSAVNTAIIQSSLPLFVFILNLVFFSIKVSKFQIIGFPITLVGVITIVFQGQPSLLLELNLNIGDILMVVAVASYGMYTALLKNRPNIHWLSIMAMLAIAAFVSSIPFAVEEVISARVLLPDLTGLSVVIYTALFASIGAQVFWMRSIELIGANATSLFINLVPLFGSILAVTLLGEQFHLFHAAGFALILVGIFIGRLKVN